MTAVDFDQIWPAICETPAWSVTKGQGSFLTFEFGQPVLHIREPLAGSPGTETPYSVSMPITRRVVMSGA